MTSLHLHRKAGIPPLAWLLALDGDSASLTCGESVAVDDEVFVEGAWAGTFDEWDFHSCCEVFGSGAYRTTAGWLVVPPSHTLECVFLLRPNQRTWIASNSLAFLCAATGARFRRPSRRLAPVLVRIVNGLRESPIALETTAGPMWAVYHHNCLLTASDFQIVPKPLPPAFPDYMVYVTYLGEALSRTARNAAAPLRHHAYPLLTTLSSGYDSPACAVLARKAGCEEAVTIDTARGGASDAGTPIARHLDLSVVAVDRPENAHGLHDAEVEFLATGLHAEDSVHAIFAGHVPRRTLVTGFHGGKVWDRWSTPGDCLESGDASGMSFAEFRLARDYIHVPLPFLGAQRHTEIVGISNSEEMRPYFLNNTYDRPIPRRIVEEAGVPREAFGQTKKAVSLLGFIETDLLSDETRGAVDNIVGGLNPIQKLLYKLHCEWFSFGMKCHDWLPRGKNILPKPIRPIYQRISKKVLRIIFRNPFKVFEHSNPFMGVAFVYALQQVSIRYDVATIDERADRSLA